MLVDDDAVVDREPGGPGEVDVRGHADARDDEVGRDRRRRRAARRRTVTARDGDPAPQVDAVLDVQGRTPPPSPARARQQRRGGLLQHRHLGARGPRRGRDLQPDPARPDDRRRGRRGARRRGGGRCRRASAGVAAVGRASATLDPVASSSFVYRERSPSAVSTSCAAGSSAVTPCRGAGRRPARRTTPPGARTAPPRALQVALGERAAARRGGAPRRRRARRGRRTPRRAGSRRPWRPRGPPRRSRTCQPWRPPVVRAIGLSDLKDDTVHVRTWNYGNGSVS